jgi:tetratricopeptide (TPR) repeat protein
MVAEARLEGTALELVNTPFYAQVTDQCGPSALAAVLNVSGVAVAPEELKSSIYIPGREGSLQIEILATIRGYQRIAYLISPEIAALLSELRDGRPVLVLQNLGSSVAPVWHYAVVVGYLPGEQRFVLRSGDHERHLLSESRFIRSWRRAGYWAVVALVPGELPALADADQYIRAVATVEAVGDFKSAAAAYLAATKRWPDEILAWLGLGNAYYAQGNLAAAERSYRSLLAMDSGDAVALNNLSQVQADLGCYEEASTTLDAALSTLESNTAMYKIIAASQQEIGSRRSSASCM